MGQRISVIVIEDGEVLAGFYNHWNGYTEKVHMMMYSIFHIFQSADEKLKKQGFNSMNRATFHLCVGYNGVFDKMPTIQENCAEEYGINLEWLENLGVEEAEKGLQDQILLGEDALELFDMAEGYAILDIGEKLSTHIKDKIQGGRYYLNDLEAFPLLEVRSAQDVRDDIEREAGESQYDEVIGNDEVVLFHSSESREGSLYQYEEDDSDDEWDMEELTKLYEQRKWERN